MRIGLQAVNVKDPEVGKWNIITRSDTNYSLRLSGLTDLRFQHGFSTNKPKSIDETSHRPLHG